MSTGNSNFSAACKVIYIENAEGKACRVNRPTLKLRRETAVRREIFRIVPVYEPQANPQNRPEPGLFRGSKFDGECLWETRLEQR
jgi:hypothetical protein